MLIIIETHLGNLINFELTPYFSRQGSGTENRLKEL
jgi:hypothetical protein